ncbi:MAG: phosphate ABC transporter substrate-binding protein [Ruminococcaceae bacterium]|nr:phosphate ABC transporter substrate-binding protein [Oscillospiraceae bacterium]
MKKLIICAILLTMCVFCLNSCLFAVMPELNNAQIQSDIHNKPDLPPSDVNEQPAQRGFEFTTENYPKMGGSLANLPLGEAVTATVLGTDRTTANEMITFEGSTTDNYKALVDGEFDIILAYEMGEEAVEYAAEKQVELEMTPIGTDALVFICSLENKVESLTKQQIEEIYKGNITNWKDVGGKDHNIIAYQRNKDSGSQTLFDKLVNLGDELMEAPAETRIGSMIGLLEAVADYENSADALGYTVYYYLTNMEKDKLDTSKLLAVDGVAPTNDTIAQGQYPYVNDFYVVIRKDASPDSPERILYNWIISEQGKELARRENYVVKPE